MTENMDHGNFPYGAVIKVFMSFIVLEENFCSEKRDARHLLDNPLFAINLNLTNDQFTSQFLSD